MVRGAIRGSDPPGGRMLTLARIQLALLASLSGIGGAVVALFISGGGAALCVFLGGQCVAAFLMPDIPE